jgi:signal transduction histidine kinase
MISAPDDSPTVTISGASHRLRALAALSGSLTDALDPAEAAKLVEEKALSALGATSAVVVTLGDFPPLESNETAEELSRLAPTLNVVHSVGLPAEVQAALQKLPLDAPVPLAEVARLGEPIFLPSEVEMRRFPDWAAAMIAAGTRAAAVVPVWANGELRGVLGLSWSEHRIFDEDERAFVLTLGVMCAQAIMRSHLKAAELLARAVAEQANRSKAHFVATISHELRTPINAVLGYTSLLTDGIDGPISPLQLDHLGRMRASGRHLLELIEELLGYARIDVHEGSIENTVVSLPDVIAQSCVLVQPAADARGVRLLIVRPAELVEIRTDERKLRQILVNLLANAIKFAEPGDVVLRVRLAESVGKRVMHFDVADSGCGIAVEHRSRIFEPFWRADPGATPSAGSTGLGLSVARELARLLRGDVTLLESAIGVGSTFTLELPVE